MVMEIAEQLTLLAELTSVEAKWKEARYLADTLPAEAKKAQDAADEKKEALTVIERKQHEIEMARRGMEQDLQSEKDKLRKWENRADQIRGEREHAALMSEIGGQKRAITRTENDILEKMQELEDLGKEFEKGKEASDNAQTFADQEWKKVDADVKAAEAEAKTHDDARNALVAKLPPALVKRYERIAERRGTAVAIINGEMCSACRTTMPPQLVLQVYKGVVLETCAVCQRILVHEAMTRAPDGDTDETPAGDAAPA
jgi:predicted  nucleic acid-binding Zn-ribbon protein